MKINMRSAAALRRAAELYTGESLPLSANVDGRGPLSFEWWKSHPQREELNEHRHKAALKLYGEIGGASAHALPTGSFPAIMDFEDQAMRPDKGALKVFIDEHVVEHRMMGAQLFFDLTASGRAFLDR